MREAVILAAGLGGRIREQEDDLPKPLHQVAGVPLIKRTILTLARAGIQKVHVIIGFMGDQIREAVRSDPAYARAGVEINFIDNPDYEKANGVSLLKAKPHVSGPFVLSMSDHVYEDAVARAAAGADMDAADLWLCVDRNIADVYDIDDATKVRTEDERIVEIGKQLEDYDAIDCGVFAVSPKLFDTLEEVLRAKGDTSLSDGVKALSAGKRARVVDIGDAFWQDVDTPGARERAERELIRRLRKPVDGLVSRTINRRLSLAVTARLIRTNVTPNQMTAVATAIGALGVCFVWRGSWAALAFGAFLVNLQSILDGCDGEIARLKFAGSRMGEWLDNVLDDAVNVAYGLALGVASTKLNGNPVYTWLGVIGAVAFTIYNAGVYAQLALVHHTGNPFAFRWWYQTGAGDLGEMLARPGLANRLGELLRSLARRDFFLLAFMLLAFLGLPQVATIWYAAIAIGYGVQMIVHLALGGFRAHAAKP